MHEKHAVQLNAVHACTKAGTSSTCASTHASRGRARHHLCKQHPCKLRWCMISFVQAASVQAEVVHGIICVSGTRTSTQGVSSICTSAHASRRGMTSFVQAALMQAKPGHGICACRQGTEWRRMRNHGPGQQSTKRAPTPTCGWPRPKCTWRRTQLWQRWWWPRGRPAQQERERLATKARPRGQWRRPASPHAHLRTSCTKILSCWNYELRG